MEDALDQITNYLLAQSWQIAVLVAAIVVVSLALKNRSAHLRYLLWLIVLAKCLVPPLFTVSLAILPEGQRPQPVVIAPEEIAFSTGMVEPIEVVPIESVAPATELTIMKRLADVTIQQWLALGWIVGVVVFVFVVAIKALRTNRWLQRQQKPLPAELQNVIEDLFCELGVETAPKIWLIDGIGQPFVWGLLRGSIYLPANFAGVEKDEHRRDVLGHELSHILRFDAAVNLLQIIAQGIFWFHPFVWWANKKIRAEREKCCDEMAIARFGAEAKNYSAAIVETLIAEHKSTRPIPSLAVAGPVKNIEDRIKTIMKAGKKFYRRPPFITVVTVLLLALIAVPITLAVTERVSKNSDDIEKMLIEGFRANRDRFKCGVLAWNHTSKGYNPAIKRALETGGRFELWWAGKKIATKFERDEVSKGPSGDFQIKSREGGNAYNGSILSRKPKFDYLENWFEIIRWRGGASLDRQIAELEKLEHVLIDWSVIEVDGVKHIRLSGKNIDKEDVHYGAYNIWYFDPSKGYGLVREEHYNADGSLRLKHTVKLQQVVQGGWFPVEVHFESFNPKVVHEQHFVLDMKRCSFNDQAAIPEGVFESSVADKQNKKLTKILEKFSDVEPVDLQDELGREKQGSREAVENFVGAALAGEYQVAERFAHAKLDPEQIRDFRDITEGQNLRILAVYADSWSALAISSVVKTDRNQEGPLVFHLRKVILDHNANWLIDDIDIETIEKAEQNLANFLKTHTEARIIPSKKTDVQRRVIVGAKWSEGKELAGSLAIGIQAWRAEHQVDGKWDNTTLTLQDLGFQRGDLTGVYFNEDNLSWVVSHNAAKNDLRYTITVTAGSGIKSPAKITLDQDGKITEFDSTEEEQLRLESAEKLKRLGLALNMYANDHKRKCPDTLQQLKAYEPNEQDFNWLVENVEYLGKGEWWGSRIATSILIAYDKTMLKKEGYTMALFLDGHVEDLEAKHLESAEKLKKLGDALFVYASDHDDKYPDTLYELQKYGYVDKKDLEWLLENVEYLGRGKTALVDPFTPIAYDKILLVEGSKTNVLLNDCHIVFESVEKLRWDIENAESKRKLQRLGIAAAVYAAEHSQKLPDSLRELKRYEPNEKDFKWTLENVEYLSKGKLWQQDKAGDTPMAYDKSLLQKNNGTNVLFVDGHVEFYRASELEKLGIISENEYAEEEQLRLESAEKLECLGPVSYNYAIQHNHRFAESLHQLMFDLKHIRGIDDPNWFLDNVEYVVGGMIMPLGEYKKTLIGYDKTLLEKGKGTNAAFLDGHVEFCQASELKKLGIIEEITFPKNWQEIVAKRKAEKAEAIIEQNRVVYKQLNEIVDLSGLSRDMPFSEAIEELKNAVDPPLKIIVLWGDLEENADIGPDTEINMDGISGIRLSTALELLLKSVSGFAELGYVVSDGVITIATKESLPSELETRVYDISYLLGLKDQQIGQLIELIQDTIEPESWYDFGGEGTITFYENNKLIVLQSREVHQKIEELLRGLRQEAKKVAIAIESRFIFVPTDSNEIKSIFEKEKIAFVSSKPDPNYTNFLNAEQADLLLRLTQAHRDATLLTAPKVTVFDGEEATLRIQREIPYISGYSEPNEPLGQPQPKLVYVDIGTLLTVKPILRNENIDLGIDYEVSNITGYEKHMYKEKYPYEIPVIQKVVTDTRALFPLGQTILLGGQKVKAEGEDGQIVEKELLVLIKAEITEIAAEEISPPAGGFGMFRR